MRSDSRLTYARFNARINYSEWEYNKNRVQHNSKNVVLKSKKEKKIIAGTVHILYMTDHVYTLYIYIQHRA